MAFQPLVHTNVWLSSTKVSGCRCPKDTCHRKPVRTTQFWPHSHPPGLPSNINASWCPSYVWSGKTPLCSTGDLESTKIMGKIVSDLPIGRSTKLTAAEHHDPGKKKIGHGILATSPRDTTGNADMIDEASVLCLTFQFLPPCSLLSWATLPVSRAQKFQTLSVSK